MNILILAVWDHSGAGNALYQAINEYTDHEARQVVFEESYLNYPTDIVRPNNNELADLIEWADLVNLHDSNDYIIPEKAPLRPTIVTYHGSQYRARWAYYNYYDRTFGRLPTALCFDLVMFGPRWLPYAMPDHSFMRHDMRQNMQISACCAAPGYEGLPGCCGHKWDFVPDQSHTIERKQEVFRVAHAPTSRANKNTNEVIDALIDLPGIEFDLIEGVPNAECVARKAKADLLVEQFVLGYGTGTLEGFALGIPVLCDALPALDYFIKERIGELPYYQTPLNKVRETVELMRDNREVYDEAAQRGRRYWEQYHKPPVVVERFIGMCQEVLDNGRNHE